MCCCTWCLRRSGLCDNSEYTDEWKAFDMQQRKVVPLNWNIWLTAGVISNLPDGRNAPLTGLQRLQQMESTGDYESLKEYIHRNPIDDLQVTCDQALSESERNRIDYIALHHLPNDCPDNYVPVQIHGDWNCFPRTCSYLACQNEDMYHEFQVWIIYELVLNYNKYIDNEYISRGASVMHRRGTTFEQIVMFAESYIHNTPVNVEKEFKTEVKGLCKDGKYMGLWQICATANQLSLSKCSQMCKTRFE